MMGPENAPSKVHSYVIWNLLLWKKLGMRAPNTHEKRICDHHILHSMHVLCMKLYVLGSQCLKLRLLFCRGKPVEADNPSQTHCPTYTNEHAVHAVSDNALLSKLALEGHIIV